MGEGHFRVSGRNSLSPGVIFLLLLRLYLAAPGLSCGMWDLVTGDQTQSPALGAWSLSHRTTRAVPLRPGVFIQKKTQGWGLLHGLVGIQGWDLSAGFEVFS